MPIAYLELSYPPSVNDRYTHFIRDGKVQIAKAPDVIAYEQEVCYKIFPLKQRKQLPREPIKGNIVLKCRFCPSRSRLQDIDNPHKALLDALTLAGVWKNDSQVVALFSFRDDSATVSAKRRRGFVECQIIWGKDVDTKYLKQFFTT